LVTTVAGNATDIKKYVGLYPFNKRKRIIRAIREFEAEGKIRVDNTGIIHRC
jgi:hypothetical protein